MCKYPGVQISTWKPNMAPKTQILTSYGGLFWDLVDFCWVPGEFWLVLAGLCFIIYVLFLSFLSINFNKNGDVKTNGKKNTNNWKQIEAVILKSNKVKILQSHLLKLMNQQTLRISETKKCNCWCCKKSNKGFFKP